MTLFTFYNNFKNKIYTNIFYKSSCKIYKHIFESIENNATIIDIGIGNGLHFSNPEIISLIKTKNLSIVGSDIDTEYLSQCQKTIIQNGLENNVKLFLMNNTLLEHYNNVDYILLIQSYPCISEGVMDNIIDGCKKSLKIGGKIIFVQDLSEHNESNILYHTKRFIKPYIKYFTTIDFGKVSTISSFEQFLHSHQLKTIEQTKIIDTNLSGFFGSYLLSYIPSPKIKSFLYVTSFDF